jgi:hypothetical protein
VADLLASQYHWTRECIWWELDFAEIAWYLQAIIWRKKAEAGESSAGVTDEMAELYDIIEQVKAEKGI